MAIVGGWKVVDQCISILWLEKKNKKTMDNFGMSWTGGGAPPPLDGVEERFFKVLPSVCVCEREREFYIFILLYFIILIDAPLSI